MLYGTLSISGFIILPLSLSLSLSPLIVTGPRQVLDRSGDWLELVLQDVLLVDGVPDPHLTRLVRRGDVEATGTVLGDIHLEITLSQTREPCQERGFT